MTLIDILLVLVVLAMIAIVPLGCIMTRHSGPTADH
jgi:hypothetical protein